jgi:hypothetical protein
MSLAFAWPWASVFEDDINGFLFRRRILTSNDNLEEANKLNDWIISSRTSQPQEKQQTSVVIIIIIIIIVHQLERMDWLD